MTWFAPAAQVVGAAIAIKTAVDQYSAGKDQKQLADEAKAISDRNALREEAETAEKARRLAAQQRKEENFARASAAASGFATQGPGTESIALALLEQRDENKRQLDWELAAGKSRADSIRVSGAYDQQKGYQQAKAMKNKAIATGGEGAGSLALGGKGLYDWWNKP